MSARVKQIGQRAFPTVKEMFANYVEIPKNSTSVPFWVVIREKCSSEKVYKYHSKGGQNRIVIQRESEEKLYNPVINENRFVRYFSNEKLTCPRPLYDDGEINSMLQLLSTNDKYSNDIKDVAIDLTNLLEKSRNK
ncbi:hypothetical protein PPL_01747 [Heterostelium album PN500]|uniref:Uncharacterized protein n=1 Tax=Heterostelium pallidum (strain ATCC 26659 / Pp 5 / PN500) TaxID=670386 RepID=D3B0D1_HETP5|nr:hypothetical protein PPL_01747 [Heterostelium album PN500]EFA84755.1 hypothetical protein PPL_01747 [Heterostelium album PN500]|eukprot:XP_020436867.1 hypothetical protein PPL_01747 [Heterostelium album PN500]